MYGTSNFIETWSFKKIFFIEENVCFNNCLFMKIWITSIIQILVQCLKKGWSLNICWIRTEPKEKSFLYSSPINPCPLPKVNHCEQFCDSIHLFCNNIHIHTYRMKYDFYTFVLYWMYYSTTRPLNLRVYLKYVYAELRSDFLPSFLSFLPSSFHPSFFPSIISSFFTYDNMQ